jgi:hypothetical protein
MNLPLFKGADLAEELQGNSVVASESRACERDSS